MPIKILIILSVLINSCIDLNQGEMIRGVNIRRINIKKIIGKWYLSASSKITDLNLCVFCTVKQLSRDNFTITVTIAPKIKPSLSTKFILNARMKRHSNIIYTTRSDNRPGPVIVMFNIGYKSHVGLFTANTLNAITTGRQGFIYVIGRDTTFPDDILEDVKDTNFYQDGINLFDGLFGINPQSCEADNQS